MATPTRPPCLLPGAPARARTRDLRRTLRPPGQQHADPPLALPEALRDGELFTFAFYQPVGANEDMLRTDPADFRVPWPADTLAALRPKLGDMGCVTAWQVVARGQVVAVVSGVRTRRLEFALELEQEAPEAGEAPTSELPVSTDRITQIVNMTIYAGAVTDQSVNVQGVAGNIAGGQGNCSQQGDASTA